MSRCLTIVAVVIAVILSVGVGTFVVPRYTLPPVPAKSTPTPVTLFPKGATFTSNNSRYVYYSQGIINTAYYFMGEVHYNFSTSVSVSGGFSTISSYYNAVMFTVFTQTEYELFSGGAYLNLAGQVYSTGFLHWANVSVFLESPGMYYFVFFAQGNYPGDYEVTTISTAIVATESSI